MTRKVIIDCDPGIDDAVALCLGLFDSRLEVLAVTAVEGVAHADHINRNVQAIVNQLDPPRLPRLGSASAHDSPPQVDVRSIHGQDALGNSGLAVSQLHHQHFSDKIICDLVHAAPEEITIVCLGPLTNISRAFQRDPQLPSLVHRLIIMGGAIMAPGNVTAAAEFNTYYDPQAARNVFRSRAAKTLIPLDVTTQVTFAMDLLERLPSETSRMGHILHRILPFAFRAYHLELGQESIYLHGAIALLAALQPELFETAAMAGDVETSGELTTGMTVFDRRRGQTWLNNLEVALEVDAAAATDCILRGMSKADCS